MVGLNGIEPSTSPLSGVRSNQLSYRPMYVAIRTSSLINDKYYNLCELSSVTLVLPFSSLRR